MENTYLDHNDPYDMALLEALEKRGFTEQEVQGLIESERVTMQSRGNFFLDGQEIVNVYFPTNC